MTGGNNITSRRWSMRMMHRIVVVALALALATATGAGAAGQKASIIEAWFIHNESMGDPVGVEKGFFGNLQVQVIGGGPELFPIDVAMAKARAGEIAFSVAYPCNTLQTRVKKNLPLAGVS